MSDLVERLRWQLELTEQALCAEMQRADFGWQTARINEKARQEDMAKREKAEAELAAIKGQEPIYQIRPDGENWIDCTAPYFDQWKGEKRKLYAMPVAIWVQTESMKGLPLHAEPAAIKWQKPMPLDEFTEWLRREMPAGTVIGNSDWWAKRIFRKVAVAPVADKDAERWRELLISCRGSVQFDLNNYERVIDEMDRADQQRTAAYAAVSDERTRLARLLNTIDAAMAKGE